MQACVHLIRFLSHFISRYRKCSYWTAHHVVKRKSIFWPIKMKLNIHSRERLKHALGVVQNYVDRCLSYFITYPGKYTRFIQRVLNRWSKLSEQKLNLFSKVKIWKNAFNKKWWAYMVYISQNKVGVAVIIHY